MNSKSNNVEKEVSVFMSIDHLKKGNYELKILLDNKVIKAIKFTKN